MTSALNGLSPRLRADLDRKRAGSLYGMKLPTNTKQDALLAALRRCESARYDLRMSLKAMRAYEEGMRLPQPEGMEWRKSIVSDALLTTAIVAYMRVFKSGGFGPFRADDFEYLQDTDARDLHDRAEKTRDKLVAHTDKGSDGREVDILTFSDFATTTISSRGISEVYYRNFGDHIEAIRHELSSYGDSVRDGSS